MPTARRPIQQVLRSPLLWGIALTVGFYVLVYFDLLKHPLLLRYFGSHPVEYIATTMFFVGIAALGVKCWDVLRQSGSLKAKIFEPAPAGGHPAAHAELLLERLKRLPRSRQDSYLVRRLSEALANVHRRGAADALDEDLKYLSDVEFARLHSSYAFSRIIIWAIPILGFLGTVIGITVAIANLPTDPDLIADGMANVTVGLSVAFDTTAQALALSIVLMFAQFVTERMETRLLTAVDERAAAELMGRFESAGGTADAQLKAVRQMADAVVQFSERLVKRQADLWQGTMETADERFRQLSSAAGGQLETALATALEKSLESFATKIHDSAEQTAEQNRRHWSDIHDALVQSTDSIRVQQQAMAHQGEVLLRVVDATGDVVRLEDALNRNLDRLSGAQNMEEVLLTLSAAIQLLSARLGVTPAVSPDPRNDNTENQAA